MILRGQTIQTNQGRRLKIIKLLGAGGQAMVYLAQELSSSRKGVVKIFRSEFSNPNTEKRIRFLINQKLSRICHALKGPSESITHNGFIGHYSPYVNGQLLKDVLEKPNFSFKEGLLIALSVTRLVEILHNRNLAYGDIQNGNFIIKKSNGIHRVYAIDFDNFNAPGLPPPDMAATVFTVKRFLGSTFLFLLSLY